MSINRICSACKSTYSLSTTNCPRCSIPLTRYKVRRQIGGKLKTLQTPSLAEAQAFDTGHRLPESNLSLTLGDVWNQYKPYVYERNRSASDDDQRWTALLAPRFGSTPISAITPADIYALLSSMTGNAPATKHRVFALLRRLINWSIEVCLYAGPNPCSRVKLPHYDNTRTRVLAEEELQRLVGLLAVESNRRLALIVLGLLWTGKRRGELRTLTWPNVSMSNALVTLEATNTKAKKLQTFPLNSKAMAVFKEAEALRISDFVFPASSGQFFTDLENAWRRWRKKNGFEGLRLHDLRRTAISRWAKAGLNPQTIQRLSGHATLSMVMRYTQLSAEDVGVSS
jgi:integrase